MKIATGFAVNQDPPQLFEPDVLAPDQFHAILKSSHLANPERRLMAAILEDAVACLSTDPRRCGRRQRECYAEAYSWVNAGDSEVWIFSFANVCETLGIDPGYLRRGLNHWTAPAQKSRAEKPRVKTYRSGARHRKLRFRGAP
ncbi:MAG TPA: hypothetical protein VIE90_09520 [Candidatus Binatia bacterium]|jgi:hypothetical protein